MAGVVNPATPPDRRHSHANQAQGSSRVDMDYAPWFACRCRSRQGTWGCACPWVLLLAVLVWGPAFSQAATAAKFSCVTDNTIDYLVAVKDEVRE